MTKHTVTVDKASCDQCVALMINGVFCHETGCPNIKRKIECHDCGCEIEDGQVCCQDDYMYELVKTNSKQILFNAL